MSKFGKIFFASGITVLIIGLITRLFYGEWDYNILVILSIGGFSFITALVLDFRFYKEILSMKTTKNGLSLGAVVFLVGICLSAINYVSEVRNFKWDLTSEKINSLSDQTVTVLKNLEEEVEFRGFYSPGANSQEATGKAEFEYLVKLYQAENPRVKLFTFDPFKRKDLKDKYNINTTGEIIISVGSKQSTVTVASESAFTNAIVKLTRNTRKVYTLVGHGERDLEESRGTGLSRFKKYLEEEGYKVETLNLGKAGKIPDDVSVLMILGPMYVYADNELKILTDFISNGGKLLLALDPGTKSNAGKLAAVMGVEFQNLYIQDFYGLMQVKSSNYAIGAIYAEHEITSKMRKAQTIFPLASPLRKAPQSAASIMTDDLVQTELSAAAIKDIADLDSAAKEPKQNYILAMASRGKINDKAPHEFASVIVGDSDFLTNEAIDVLVANRDFALNIMASLSNDSEMISIRPKSLEGTPLVLTSVQNGGLLAILGFVPLSMFILSFVSFWRRRGA